MQIREAIPNDIPVLVKHRCAMFADMIENQTVNYTADDVAAMEAPYRTYLKKNLGRVVRAWVLENDGKIVASGAVLFNNWLPRPGDHTTKSALLHSVYTEPDYRRRGLAKQIMQALLTECRRLDIQCINLHASDAGRPMYEAMGFKQTSEMRLYLR
jgi:L-amino acid N-acyltransferase YncA